MTLKIEQHLKALVAKDTPALLLSESAFKGMADRFVREVRLSKEFSGRRSSVVIQNFSILILRVNEATALDRDYGTGASAHAVRRVASIVLQRVRGIDLIGQWKKDEVVVGLVGTSEYDAWRIAENLKQIVEALPVSFGRMRFVFTVSCGVSSVDGAKNTGALLTRARASLTSSRPRVVVKVKRTTRKAKSARPRRRGTRA